MSEESRALAGDTSPARHSSSKRPQPSILPPEKTHQVGIDALQEGIQSAAVGSAVVLHPATHDRVDLPGEVGESLRAGCVVPPVIANTTPSDSLSGADHFPGSPVIGKLAPDPRRVGAE